jgi:hypothetical protein
MLLVLTIGVQNFINTCIYSYEIGNFKVCKKDCAAARITEKLCSLRVLGNRLLSVIFIINFRVLYC